MKTKKWTGVILAAVLAVLSACSTLRSYGATYYVNDGSTTNDEWCTAPGNDANPGTSPGSPKATVKAILDYDLGPGDVVKIDTGTYNLTDNIWVSSADSGSSTNPVRFEASPYGVDIDRGNTSQGKWGWSISANYVTVTTVRGTQHPDEPEVWMKVTGAYYGIYVSGDYCRLSRIDVCNNSSSGIMVYNPADHVTIENCLVRSNDNEGIYADADYVAVKNCTFYGNKKRGVALYYSSHSELVNNIIWADGAGRQCVYVYYDPLSGSDYNDLYVTNGAHVGYYEEECPSLMDWVRETARDGQSLSRDPLFVDAAGGDFHLRSSQTEGTYVIALAAWTSYPGEDSPGIDTGFGDLGAELSPNSTPLHGTDLGQRNLGAYGGTEQGSKTPAGRLLWLYEPIGRESWAGDTGDIRWTWVGEGWGTGDTLELEYSDDSGSTWNGVAGGTSVAVEDGAFSWEISALSDGQFYRVKGTCNQNGAVTDGSPDDFWVGSRLFYVNDGSTDYDEWCDAPGDDGNSGRSPSSPKATVQAILQEYNLEPGEVVRIDTGEYNMNAAGNIEVTPTHSGSSTEPVRFEASPYGVDIDRGNTSQGKWGWSISANYVTVTTVRGTQHPDEPEVWMKVTGGNYGTYVTGDYCRLSRIDVCNNSSVGIMVYNPADHLTIENCLARSNGYDGIYAEADYVTVKNCTVYANGRRGVGLYYSSHSELVNNIIWADGAGRHCVYVYYDPLSGSDYNDLYATNGAHIGYWGPSAEHCSSLMDWRRETARDGHSLSRDPLFVDAAGGDFHLQSTVASYHGGAWTLDDSDSPGIDTGFGDLGAELSPNSTPLHGTDLGQRNLGAYGGTEQGSKTPAGRLLWLYEPIGRESWAGDTGDIRWTWVGEGWGTGDTLELEYSDDSGSTWNGVAGGTSVAVEDGAFSWEISALSDGQFYRVKGTCNQNGAVTDGSPDDFWVGSRLYYVNDGSTDYDEWCDAPGDDGNSGRSPSSPKATVQAILQEYNLEPGEVVRIDTGEYNMNAAGNIEVTATHSGSSTEPVRFEASPYGVDINRGSTSQGKWGWSISANYVTVTTVRGTRHPYQPEVWMKVTGGNCGTYVTGDYCRLSRIDACSNRYGIMVYDGHDVTIENCLARDNEYSGIYIDSDYVTVKNCTMYGNRRQGVYLGSSCEDIELLNNIICADGSGRYGVNVQSSILSNSDYNNIYATNGAHVGYYNGDVCPTLTYWQSETGLDANSLSQDPLFVNVAGDDFHLQSTAGSYHDGAWTSDADDSPCICAGDPRSDYSNEPEPNGGRINMGAYGDTEQASKAMDSDGDGLPDVWEKRIIDFYPDDEIITVWHVLPGDDFESDGLSNETEYLRGSDPTAVSTTDTWYVDASVPSSGDGTTPGTAFKTIQEGINATLPGDIVIAAEGTYQECIDFGGKAITVRSQDPSVPDVVDGTVIDGLSMGRVITFNSDEGPDSVLCGFTITGGWATSEGGGGILCNGASPVIANNVIRNNRIMTGNGAGVCCIASSAVISDNVITCNRCFGNQDKGGGIYCSGGSPEISRNTVSFNSAASHGGGICLYDSAALVMNNTVFGNGADSSGGGIHSSGSGASIISNTIANNQAWESGGGVHGGTVSNCIVWGNTAWQSPQVFEATVTYSCIEGGYAGQGNLPYHPYFVDTDADNYHLLSWSPCIDAGGPASDYSNEPEPNGGRINIGADGNTADATSKSYSDEDGDGLPDSWEQQIVDADPDDPINSVWDVAPGDDFDGDGVSNQDEFLYGSDPTEQPPADYTLSDDRLVAFDETFVSPVFQAVLASKENVEGVGVQYDVELGGFGEVNVRVGGPPAQPDLTAYGNYVLTIINTSPDDFFTVNLYIRSGEEMTMNVSRIVTLMPGASVNLSVNLGSVPNPNDVREIGFAVKAYIGQGFGLADAIRLKVEEKVTGGAGSMSVQDETRLQCADSDGDSMPDMWEIEQGLNSLLDDAGLDLDQDGQSNLAEFFAGTAVNDPASVFRVFPDSVTADSLALTWTSSPGRLYRIWHSDDMFSWSPVTHHIPADSGETTSWQIRLLPAASRGYYVIEVIR